MWTGDQIATVCDGRSTHPGLQSIQIHSVATDNRAVKPGDLFVALQGDVHDGHQFVPSALKNGATLALVQGTWTGYSDLSPSDQSKCIVVHNVLKSFRALAADNRTRFQFPVIAIGGSNGKTTSKEMLSALLSAKPGKVIKTQKSQNGYIGIAMTLCDKNLTADNLSEVTALIVEIGIDAPMAMAQHVDIVRPDCVALTALGPEHLEGLKTWEIGIAEEMKLFEPHTERSKTYRRVWQMEDPILRQHWQSRSQSTLIIDTVVFNTAIAKTAAGMGSHFPRLEFEILNLATTHSEVRSHWQPSPGIAHPFDFVVPLPGLHNAQNFALSLATALSIGWTTSQIQSGWRNFVGPEMRSRVVKLPSGASLYDDCYNASPASVATALASLCVGEWHMQRKQVILGDMLELGEESKKWHVALLDEIVKLKNTELCLYGDAMKDLFDAIFKNALSSKFESVLWLPKKAAPTDFLTPDSQCTLFFVKGSRGMDLGRVVDALEK